ncbi:MAG TPA: hypothetical protein VK131_09130 [Candidatus Acidoferrales bacterium]|nr:hypothetical protein [Candidatus Acidoferrales bacterium]
MPFWLTLHYSVEVGREDERGVVEGRGRWLGSGDWPCPDPGESPRWGDPFPGEAGAPRRGTGAVEGSAGVGVAPGSTARMTASNRLVQTAGSALPVVRIPASSTAIAPAAKPSASLGSSGGRGAG